MKKSLFILAAILILASCSRGPKYSGLHGEKTQKDAEAEFVSSLASADSSAVVELAERCMSLLKGGQIAEAVDMIYVLHDNVLYKKSASYTTDLIQRFTTFPVVTYKLNYFSFSTQGNNDVSYTYSFANNDASSMKIMFNPVKVDDVWYLTFKDGSQSSRDLPLDKQIHQMAPAPADIKLNNSGLKSIEDL